MDGFETQEPGKNRRQKGNADCKCGWKLTQPRWAAVSILPWCYKCIGRRQHKCNKDGTHSCVDCTECV